jgi:hypothetical protein
MNGRHRNLGWSSGQLAAVPPDIPPVFERRAHELGLTVPTYVESGELRRWCQDNRNKCYIPEWLLKTWGISVNSDVP